MQSRWHRTALLAFLILVTPTTAFARGDTVGIRPAGRLTGASPGGKSRDLGARSGGRVYPRNAVRSFNQTRPNSPNRAFLGK